MRQNVYGDRSCCTCVGRVGWGSITNPPAVSISLAKLPGRLQIDGTADHFHGYPASITPFSNALLQPPKCLVKLRTSLILRKMEALFSLI